MKKLLNKIAKAKLKLQKSKFVENFGEKEIEKIAKSLDQWNMSIEGRQKWQAFQDFAFWCENYTPNYK